MINLLTSRLTPTLALTEQEGDGLPDMITPTQVDLALKAAGFDILEARDAALDPNPGGIPWFQPLTPSWNVLTQRFQFTWLGMRITKAALWVMELVRNVLCFSFTFVSFPFPVFIFSFSFLCYFSCARYVSFVPFFYVLCFHFLLVIYPMCLFAA